MIILFIFVIFISGLSYMFYSLEQKMARPKKKKAS